MSNIISLTALSYKNQSELTYRPLTGTKAFDIDDISSVILSDSKTGYSSFEINPFKGIQYQNNSTKEFYQVSDSLISIAAQSTGLILLPVISRRGVTVSYNAIFVSSKITQRIEVAPGGGGTSKFWYIEDGDVTPVEYIVNATIASIIAPTNLTNRVLSAAASDETTPITTGVGKTTFQAPFACTLVSLFAALTTAQVSGSIFTVDIRKNGTSIFSTLLTIDNTELTSLTAATLPVLTGTITFAKGDAIRVDVTQVGSGEAVGLKVYLNVNK